MVYRSLFCIVYLAPYFPTVIAFVWNHNALKLLVLFFFFSFFFSFFCQPCLRLRNCKSVFLILKISEYGGLRLWVQLFPRYPCKNWYKNWHLHFYKTYDHQIWQADTSRAEGVDSNETNQAGAGDVITSRLRDKLKTIYSHY